MIRTVDDLFHLFGGPAEVGRIIGVRTEHAMQMKRRRSIPEQYRPKLIEAAAERAIEGVTYESLTLIHARRPEPAGATP